MDYVVIVNYASIMFEYLLEIVRILQPPKRCPAMILIIERSKFAAKCCSRFTQQLTFEWCSGYHVSFTAVSNSPTRSPVRRELCPNVWHGDVLIANSPGVSRLLLICNSSA